MRITYDPSADALAVSLIDRGKVVKTVRQADDVQLDYDAAGHLVAIEVLAASAHFERVTLARFDSPATWLTLTQAAEEAGLSPATLRVQLNNGRIRGEKRGRDWFIAQHELWTYLESRAPQGRPAVANTPARRGTGGGFFRTFGTPGRGGGIRDKTSTRPIDTAFRKVAGSGIVAHKTVRGAAKKAAKKK
jgi:YD repeat-containing protein